MQSLTLDGPAGSLDALYQVPENHVPGAASAVLAHPHPQMGGSMHDRVLEVAARVLVERGIACLRFNFRGVGASAGSHDGGEGERDDLRAMLDWLGQTNDGPLWVVGYSFGSWVAWRTVHAGNGVARVERLILIAPPVGALDYPDRQIPDLQVKIVVGDGDDFIDLAKLTAWAERVGVPAPTLISGADHFFASQGDALTAALRGFAD